MEAMNMTGRDLDFVMTVVVNPGGRDRYIQLAFGSDGTMWIDPADMGIGPQHAPQLARFPGRYYLMVNPSERRVLLNAHAVVLVKTDPTWCRQWLAWVDGMIEGHMKVRGQYESTRYN